MSHLFILGPARTASTSLSYWLSQHNDFCVSKPKEARFFEFEYHLGMHHYYRKYFHHHSLKEKVIVDANPIHLIVDYVRARIKESIEEPKFIITLRNPFQRAYSDWYNWHTMRPGRTWPTFKEAISQNLMVTKPKLFRTEGEYVPFCDAKGGSYIPMFVESGLYFNLSLPYIRDFGKDNILFLDFDDVIEDKQGTIDKISDFMEVDRQIISDFSKRNMPGSRTSDKTFDEIRSEINGLEFDILNEMFYIDTKALITELGNKISKDYITEWQLK